MLRHLEKLLDSEDQAEEVTDIYRRLKVTYKENKEVLLEALQIVKGEDKFRILAKGLKNQYNTQNPDDKKIMKQIFKELKSEFIKGKIESEKLIKEVYKILRLNSIKKSTNYDVIERMTVIDFKNMKIDFKAIFMNYNAAGKEAWKLKNSYKLSTKMLKDSLEQSRIAYKAVFDTQINDMYTKSNADSVELDSIITSYNEYLPSQVIYFPIYMDIANNIFERGSPSYQFLNDKKCIYSYAESLRKIKSGSHQPKTTKKFSTAQDIGGLFSTSRDGGTRDLDKSDKHKRKSVSQITPRHEPRTDTNKLCSESNKKQVITQLNKIHDTDNPLCTKQREEMKKVIFMHFYEFDTIRNFQPQLESLITNDDDSLFNPYCPLEEWKVKKIKEEMKAKPLSSSEKKDTEKITGP